MSENRGFDADVETINGIATKDLPDIVSTVNSEASMVFNLGMSADRGAGSQASDNSGSVFSNSTVHSDLGTNYNAVIAQLQDGLTAIATSVGTAADRLKKVADNYERIDQSLAGQ